MPGEYKIPEEFAKQTRYIPSGLAREVLLRMGAAPDDARYGTDLKAHWDDERTAAPVDLTATSVDGPYTLVKRSLTSSLQKDIFRFDKESDVIEVRLAPDTDLTEVDVSQLPFEVEELLLQSGATRDSRERGSTRAVDEEEFEEISAALAVQHLLTPRLYYPRHTKQLIHEHVDDEPGFYDEMIGDLIDQLRVEESFESFEIRKELFEISRRTEFRVTDRALFFTALTKTLGNTYLMQRAIPEKSTENAE